MIKRREFLKSIITGITALALPWKLHAKPVMTWEFVEHCMEDFKKFYGLDVNEVKMKPGYVDRLFNKEDMSTLTFTSHKNHGVAISELGTNDLQYTKPRFKSYVITKNKDLHADLEVRAWGVNKEGPYFEYKRYYL